MRRSSIFAFLLLLALPPLARATVFATVHGVVHDQRHHPIAGAKVSLEAAESEFKLESATGANGEFEILQVPIGVYRLKVNAPGFVEVVESLSISSATNPVLHIPLAVAASSESVVVSASPTTPATDSATPTTLITRADIDQTPGASRTIGMEMITDYVPGAYMTHDMLHMRGGHQTSGSSTASPSPTPRSRPMSGRKSTPRTSTRLKRSAAATRPMSATALMASSTFFPAMDSSATATAELLVSGGNLYTGETQFSLGDHSAATAWYASVTGSRSNYGLATPVANIYHDATNSQSGFVSLIRNQTPKDQLRLDGQYRQDHFQIPYDPDPNDYECDLELLLLLWPARRPIRARFLRHRQLGSHPFTQGAVCARALLPLQPGKLRFTHHRPAGRHHLAPDIELRRGAGRLPH